MASFLTLTPPQKLQATLILPGSKSYSNRALIVASLAQGDSLISQLLASDDIAYMQKALQQLGVRMESKTPDKLLIHKAASRLQTPSKPLDVGLSGTACRLLLGVCSLLAQGQKATVTGRQRLQERPVKELIDTLNQLGVKSHYENQNGYPPVTIFGGGFIGSKASLAGHISSQYLTAILLVAPYAQKDVEINIIGDLTSKPYVDITMDIMKSFQVQVEHHNYQQFKVKAGQKYQPREYLVEPDASSASYFAALAAVLGGNITLQGVRSNSCQGDWKMLGILEKMGCTINWSKEGVQILGPQELQGVEVDMNTMPDVVMTIAACAAFAKGRTTIKNVANLRIKETDRLKATAVELRRCGVEVQELPDGLIITPTAHFQPAVFKTYDDHRMAMVASILASRIPDCQIEDPGVISKSFPQYWDFLKKIGFQIQLSP